MDSSAVRFYYIRFDAVLSIFRSIHMDIGTNLVQEFSRISLFKPSHIGDKFERRNNLQPVVQRNNGSIRTFVLLNRGIRV